MVAVTPSCQLEHLVAETPADRPGDPPAEELALELEFPSRPAELLPEAARQRRRRSMTRVGLDDLERLGRALGAAFWRITGR